MVRVVTAGPSLSGFVVTQPAMSVRLLLPSRDGRLEIPSWNGNAFVFDDGTRPTLRTLTPQLGPMAKEISFDVVIHDGGELSRWAIKAAPGSPCAISGPARGWSPDLGRDRFVLVGDESALIAIEQLLELLPSDAWVDVIVEIPGADSMRELEGLAADSKRRSLRWVVALATQPGAAMVAAFAELDPTGAQVFAAGEAAAVQQIRKLCFDDHGLERADTWIRGHWKFK